MSHEYLAAQLDDLADRPTEAGYPCHGWTIRLVVENFERLASLEAELKEAP